MIDKLLLFTGNMSIEKSKVIEKIGKIKKYRKLVIIEILDCEDCIKNNYLQKWKNN